MKENNNSLYKAVGLHEHTCKVCGKKFECFTDYVYKKRKNNKGSYYYFCSYTCYRKDESNRVRSNRSYT